MSSVRRVHVNSVIGLTHAKAFRHSGRLHPEYYPFGNIVMLLKLAHAWCSPRQKAPCNNVQPTQYTNGQYALIACPNEYKVTQQQSRPIKPKPTLLKASGWRCTVFAFFRFLSPVKEKQNQAILRANGSMTAGSLVCQPLRVGTT